MAPEAIVPGKMNFPIILCCFSLTEGDKLLPSTRKHLKQEYDRLKGLNNDFDEES